eukprot:151947-Rhodomonas_salina.1
MQYEHKNRTTKGRSSIHLCLATIRAVITAIRAFYAVTVPQCACTIRYFSTAMAVSWYENAPVMRCIVGKREEEFSYGVYYVVCGMRYTVWQCTAQRHTL